MKKSLIDWENGPWTREIYSPDYLERQMDGWSCGLFILMALLELNRDGEGMDVHKITNARLDDMRLKTINLILDIP